MEFRGIFAVLAVILFGFYLQTVVCFPRDSSVVKTDEIEKVTDRTEDKLPTAQILDHSAEPTKPVPVIHIHQDIHCDFEDATEDTICQEHCLPKGYNYGLCVGGKCSCV